jgi:hypothetical protein
MSALLGNATLESPENLKGILVPAPGNFTPRDQ